MMQHRLENLKLPTYRAGLLQSCAHRKLTLFMTARLKENDLSLPEWAFLGLVYESGGLRLQDLAEALDVKPSFATRLARTLQKKNLIIKATDNTDSRARLIALTPSGKELVKQVEKKLRTELRKHLSGIDPRDLNIYLRVVSEISRLP